jgi:hypothetical protein
MPRRLSIALDLVRNANPVGKAITRVSCPLAVAMTESAFEYIARTDHITLPQSRYTPPLRSSLRHSIRSYSRTRSVRHINYISRREGEVRLTAVRLFVFLTVVRACIGAHREASCHCHSPVGAGWIRPSGQSCFSRCRRHDLPYEIRL